MPSITGTYQPCVECRAPMIFGHDASVQSRITVSGNPDAAKITPHTDECTVGQRPGRDATVNLSIEFTMQETDADAMRLLFGQTPFTSAEIGE